MSSVIKTFVILKDNKKFQGFKISQEYIKSFFGKENHHQS